VWQREWVTEERRSPALSARHWFDAVFGQAAFVIPLIVTAFRAGSAPVWRDDLPVARALGLLPAGTEGRVTTVLVQLLSLLPLGGRWLRASWVGALSLALCSYLIYALARRVLERAVNTPRLTPALALAGALTATLSLSFQMEGTVTGGAPMATALVLAGILLGFEMVERTDARLSLVLGALVGLALSEAHAAALVLLFTLLVQGATHRVLPRPRAVLAFFGGLLVFWGFALLPMWVRPLAVQGGLDLGHGLAASSLALIDASGARSTALSTWLTDVGAISFGLAIAGLVLGLLRGPTRASVVPLLALVLADLAIPVSRVAVLTPDAFGALRLLAVAALAVCAALAVQTSAVALTRARIPFAQPASVLLVVFDFTLVFVGSEASAAATERRESVASEVWTDEGLRSVPPNGLLLARSEAIAWRLWSAQLLRGERPDVLVVPATLLERGALRRRLLGAEPALAPLLRDLALGGKPSEFALATLADARPLFVELDASWDDRLNEHVVPEAFWLRFQANPVGRSDRSASLERAGRRFERVLSAIAPAEFANGALATREVVIAGLRQRALFLFARRDRDTALATADQLERLSPRDEIAQKVRAGLASARPGLTARR